MIEKSKMRERIENILTGLLVLTILVSGIVGMAYQAVSPYSIPPEGYHPFVMPMVQHHVDCPKENQQILGRRRGTYHVVVDDVVDGLTCRPILSDVLV